MYLFELLFIFLIAHIFDGMRYPQDVNAKVLRQRKFTSPISSYTFREKLAILA